MISALSVAPESGPLTNLLMTRFIALRTATEGIYQSYFRNTSAEADMRFTRTVKAFSAEYKEYMNASYVSSGNYFDNPMVAGDLVACGALAQGN